MRMCLITLFTLCLFSLLYQPSTARSYRLRYWKGFFLFPRNKCHYRCVRKHGFFKDDKGDYQMASVPKRMVVKCQCMVSSSLRKLITNRFNDKVANSYGRYNFFGFTKKGREKLHSLAESRKIPAIKFVSWDEFRQIVRQQEAVESKMPTATAETVVKMETHVELQRIAAQWKTAEALAKAAGGAVTTEELKRIMAQRKAADARVKEAAAALTRQRLAAMEEAAEAIERERAQQEAADAQARTRAQQAANEQALAQQTLAQQVPAVQHRTGKELTYDDYERILAEWRATLPKEAAGEKSSMELLDQIIAKFKAHLESGGGSQP